MMTVSRLQPSLGRFTAGVVKVADWAKSNPNCPSSRKWADEFERVFEYADAQGQFANYFNRLTKSYSQFDSALAELRVAYYLDCIGLPVSKWEPIPSSGNAGEFMIKCPSGKQVFTEVKSPGWESELQEADLKAGRAKQEKHKDMEGAMATPYAAIQLGIQKAYKKFDPASPNLLVIADDLFVQLENAPEMFAQQALFDPGGCFTSSTYQNLGGVGIFWVDRDCEPLNYKLKLFLNDKALSTAAIPEEMIIRLR